jgi:hypothetical protein
MVGFDVCGWGPGPATGLGAGSVGLGGRFAGMIIGRGFDENKQLVFVHCSVLVIDAGWAGGAGGLFFAGWGSGCPFISVIFLVCCGYLLRFCYSFFIDIIV